MTENCFAKSYYNFSFSYSYFSSVLLSCSVLSHPKHSYRPEGSSFPHGYQEYKVDETLTDYNPYTCILSPSELKAGHIYEGNIRRALESIVPNDGSF